MNKNIVSVRQTMTQRIINEPKTIEKFNPIQNASIIERTKVSNSLNHEKIVKTQTENFDNKLKKNQINFKSKINITENIDPEIVSKKAEIILPKLSEEHKEVIIENGTNKTNIKYVKSEDLLFGRELEKASIEQENTKSKMGNLELKFKSPKTIEILGFTVYSEENKKQ